MERLANLISEYLHINLRFLFDYSEEMKSTVHYHFVKTLITYRPYFHLKKMNIQNYASKTFQKMHYFNERLIDAYTT